MSNKKYQVTVRTDPQDAPKDHEMSAALIMANHFKTDIIFLRPDRYKTPDFDINGTKWEPKSPTGSGKKTMENNLRSARKQSNRVVIDLRRCRLHQIRALSRIKFYLDTDNHDLQQVKVITKSRKIIDIL